MTRRAWIVGGIGALLIGAALIAWGWAAGWDGELATGVAGLWLGAAGFSIAIAEIRRAATASEATERAVKRTLVAVAATRLAVTVTQMAQTAEQVEASRSIEEAREGLNTWRRLAGDAQGLVRRRFGARHKSLVTLRRAMRIVSETKSNLYSEPNLNRALRDGLRAMDEVADELGPLLEQLLPTIDEEDDDG